MKEDIMTVDEYLKQNIDSGTIQMAKEFIESSHYRKIKSMVQSETYKKAQEALKLRDSIIHKDTLVQIKRLQEEMQSENTI